MDYDPAIIAAFLKPPPWAVEFEQALYIPGRYCAVCDNEEFIVVPGDDKGGWPALMCLRCSTKFPVLELLHRSIRVEDIFEDYDQYRELVLHKHVPRICVYCGSDGAWWNGYGLFFDVCICKSCAQRYKEDVVH